MWLDSHQNPTSRRLLAAVSQGKLALSWLFAGVSKSLSELLPPKNTEKKYLQQDTRCGSRKTENCCRLLKTSLILTLFNIVPVSCGLLPQLGPHPPPPKRLTEKTHPTLQKPVTISKAIKRSPFLSPPGISSLRVAASWRTASEELWNKQSCIPREGGFSSCYQLQTGTWALLSSCFSERSLLKTHILHLYSRRKKSLSSDPQCNSPSLEARGSPRGPNIVPAAKSCQFVP